MPKYATTSASSQNKNLSGQHLFFPLKVTNLANLRTTVKTNYKQKLILENKGV
jgi:hypothetical protein